MGFGKSDLECITKFFWDKDFDLDSRLKYYICENQKRLNDKSLLEAELEYAKKGERINVKSCKTLVLLVGFSPEPLLQSICVYKPEKIVLLLNENGYSNYGAWSTFANHIVTAVEYLKDKGLIRKDTHFHGEQTAGKPGYPTPDNPADIFKTLVEVLHDEEDVVIDITGGKKSMVTGAYLYAAYAGARISYVDFEDYDPKSRRPYGFSCKIGEISNPYKEFALREWERVRILYERYQFREARELLTKIRDSMKTVIPDTEEPIKKIILFLDYYEKWDRGDFRGAKEAAQMLGNFDQPSAVVELGNKWYEIKGANFENIPKRFYGDLQSVKLYVYDELKRIRRLIEYNQDYRSAFLRAGGVNEIIMIARLVQLVKNHQHYNLFLEKLDEKTPEISKVFDSLTKPEKEEINIKKDIPFDGFRKKNDPDIIVQMSSPMATWWKDQKNMFGDDNGWDSFLDKRNKLAHKYFAVPRDWAEDALKFVEANFEDFLGQRMSELSLCAETLPWSKLCELCGMNHFLPPNLR
ncbi:TM1812 family CRISPR-associated protein [Carboxydocella sp. ULO1]|uniref:TM1812 family CRISPR-associated protein n=1 Tax=Carboxydocella sp. ULO1 TaxID=1926599 RepID=UPI0009C924F5|nr:TM1812 family CRISPR-associated protein [Carboxydocella sp. ULO1]GAW27547.1 CRISPR-associated protein Cas02710 [Carboxydocella sp. ULO1]